MRIGDVTELRGRGVMTHTTLDAEPEGDVRTTWKGARLEVVNGHNGIRYTTTILGVEAFAMLGGPGAGDPVGLLVRGGFPGKKGDEALVRETAPKWMKANREELVEAVAKAMKVAALMTSDDWLQGTAIEYVNERAAGLAAWEHCAEDFVTAWEDSNGE